MLRLSEWDEKRAKLLLQDKNICQHCGATPIIVNHQIIPKSEDETNDPDKLLKRFEACQDGYHVLTVMMMDGGG